MYFGMMHLLGYRASYTEPLYRFADFNAGWQASRNAAFQAAVSRASGIELALDGDLLRPGASLDDPGAPERAVRALRLDLGDAAIRRALETGDAEELEDTALHARARKSVVSGDVRPCRSGRFTHHQKKKKHKTP